MGIFSFFRRRPAKDDDFEDILNGLEASIREREERLASVRQREKRGVVWLTTYSLLAWLLYAGAWYARVFEWARELLYGAQVAEKEAWEEILWTLPVGGIPIVLFFTRRIVKWWYRRKQERENKELVSLRKRQREQIDKLKKLSNYDKITEMLERHGERPFPKPGTPGRTGAPAPSRPSSAYTTPVKQGAGPTVQSASTPAQQAILAAQQAGRAQQANAKRGVFPAPPGGRPLPPGSPMQGGHHGDDLAPLLSQQKGLIDKLADVLLGDSEQAPTSKYALICQRCFSHNGLVLKEEIMDIQFVCPKCGFFNPSRRRRATGEDVSETPARSREASGNASESSASGPVQLVASLTSQGDASEEEEDKEETMEAESEEKPTAPMNVDERKENLRRRQSSGKGVKQRS